MTDQMIWLLRNMGEMKSFPVGFMGKKFDKLFAISNFTAMEEIAQIEYLREFHKRLDGGGAMRTAIEKSLNQGME